MNVCIVRGEDPYKTTKKLLDMLRFGLKDKKVFIKPNLTTAGSAESGITTDVNVIRAILEKLKNCEVTIGEGSGANTFEAFKANGYFELSEEFGAKLVDLNNDEAVVKKIPAPVRFRQLSFAKAVLNSEYVIDVAKLKTHSFATVTLCLKNLFGTITPRKNRVMVHPFINKAICDIAQVVKPQLNIVDGIVGNQLDEVRSNPVNSNIVIGGYDALSVDLVACQCMGIDPGEVGHLNLAQAIFGEREINVLGEKIENVKKQYRRGKFITNIIRYAGLLRYAGERLLWLVYK